MADSDRVVDGLKAVALRWQIAEGVYGEGHGIFVSPRVLAVPAHLPLQKGHEISIVSPVGTQSAAVVGLLSARENIEPGEGGQDLGMLDWSLVELDRLCLSVGDAEFKYCAKSVAGEEAFLIVYDPVASDGDIAWVSKVQRGFVRTRPWWVPRERADHLVFFDFGTNRGHNGWSGGAIVNREGDLLAMYLGTLDFRFGPMVLARVSRGRTLDHGILSAAQQIGGTQDSR